MLISFVFHLFFLQMCLLLKGPLEIYVYKWTLGFTIIPFVISSAIDYETPKQRGWGLALSTIFYPGSITVLACVGLYKVLLVVMKLIFKAHVLMSKAMTSSAGFVSQAIKNRTLKPKQQSKMLNESLESLGAYQAVQNSPYRDAPVCDSCSRTLP